MGEEHRVHAQRRGVQVVPGGGVGIARVEHEGVPLRAHDGAVRLARVHEHHAERPGPGEGHEGREAGHQDQREGQPVAQALPKQRQIRGGDQYRPMKRHQQSRIAPEAHAGDGQFHADARGGDQQREKSLREPRQERRDRQGDQRDQQCRHRQHIAQHAQRHADQVEGQGDQRLHPEEGHHRGQRRQLRRQGGDQQRGKIIEKLLPQRLPLSGLEDVLLKGLLAEQTGQRRRKQQQPRRGGEGQHEARVADAQRLHRQVRQHRR